MFNSSPKNQDNKNQKKKTVQRDAAVTILTSGCLFQGKLYCRGSSRIGGRIEGQIISEGLLIIEEEAVIMADIQAEEVVIQGRVLGKLEAGSRVELCASSVFEGDVMTPVLVVNEGAQFNGRSKMKIKEPISQRDDIFADIKGSNDHSPDIGDSLSSDNYVKAPDVAVLKVSEASAP